MADDPIANAVDTVLNPPSPNSVVDSIATDLSSAPAQPSSAPAQPQGRDRVKERIDALFGQRKEAEERAVGLASQVEELRSQLLQMQQQNAQLRTGGSGAPTQPVVNPFSGQSGGQPDTVRAAIEEAVGPLKAQFEQQQRLAQVNALNQQQSVAFDRAATELPEMRDKTSEVHLLSAELYSRDPYLKGHPNGPYLAAMAAAGMLRQSGAPAVSPQLKVAAGVPAGPLGSVLGGGPAAALAKMEQQYTALGEAMRNGADPEKCWPLLRQLQQRIADAKGITPEHLPPMRS